MESDFIKMAAQPPLMSTPIKGKYSSLFQEIALLPYKLFGRCSRDNSVPLEMDSPKRRSSIPPGINTSPCRHSLRLLSNGYYICDEDSLYWDDLGNISFSPTQCTVSYKENMVRIFRRRRRPSVQRRLDLPSHGYCDDMEASCSEDRNDIEPLVVEQLYSTDENSCGFSHERQVVKNSSTDSIATTLTPAIGSDSIDADDSIESSVMILLIFITLLILCLILWWDRSHDNFCIRTRPGI
ncbi:transmembrane protein 71 isoform X2 [Ranitomeya variabilis]|uniref:transmembrane protein 71 isoform X2 n=1 Tax=Ranitomeya variabilis TaxID=490064 RepID=UPI004056F1B5